MSVVPDYTPITSIFEVLTNLASDRSANDMILNPTLPKKHVIGSTLVIDDTLTLDR